MQHHFALIESLVETKRKDSLIEPSSSGGTSGSIPE
jgi:hypothetical protein